jgi:hypothetical protein
MSADDEEHSESELKGILWINIRDKTNWKHTCQIIKCPALKLY